MQHVFFFISCHWECTRMLMWKEAFFVCLVCRDWKCCWEGENTWCLFSSCLVSPKKEAKMKSHLQHLGLYSDLYITQDDWRWRDAFSIFFYSFVLWCLFICHIILVGCICKQHICICMFEMYISFVALLTLSISESFVSWLIVTNLIFSYNSV